MKRILCCFLVLFLTTPTWAAKKEWDETKGTHFIIYYRDVPQDFVQTVMDSAEEEYTAVTANLGVTRYQGWTWAKRASIYIYHDEDDYKLHSGQAVWSHGAALAQTKTIVTFPAVQGFFDSILPHEMGHIIFREIIGYEVNVPLWFEEGVAMYQEKAKRLGVNKTIKDAQQKGQFIPLSTLTDMQLYNDTPQETVELYYAESASIVYYLISELGEQRFYRLCHVLKENTPFLTALSQVYVRIKDLNVLNKMWLQYLEEQK